MPNVPPEPFTTAIQQSHIDLRGIYLGADFVRTFQLEAKKKYQIQIVGTETLETAGTLQGWFIGGLAKMYASYDLQLNDSIVLDFRDGTLIVTPPEARRKLPVAEGIILPTEAGSSESIPTETQAITEETVFARQKLKYLHIPEFAPANLTGWNPQSETDMYLVFGMLSENTDFRYCCGTSKNLLVKLGYNADTKPDAILIDRSTDEYLMSEFKMYSSDFASNHNPNDVDVLVCWIDDAVNRTQLPKRVVALKDLREKAVKDGSISLDDLS